MPDEPPPAAPAEPPPVVADVHEPGEVVAELRRRGVPVEVRKLQPADYVVGPVAVERKTVRDLARSLFDKRLFDQVERVRAAYPQGLLVVEGDMGELDEFEHPQAFYGALCHVALDRGVPVVPTADHEHTAILLATLHRRVDKAPSLPALRHKPPGLDPREEMLFVVQGLPSVGNVLGANLLDHFVTARRVMRANERELRRIPLVGPEKARRITEVLDRPWEGRQRRLAEGEER